MIGPLPPQIGVRYLCSYVRVNLWLLKAGLAPRMYDSLDSELERACRVSNWWRSIVASSAVIAMSTALAVVVPTHANADTVGSYTSRFGTVTFTSTEGGFLRATATGLRPTGSFNGQSYDAECFFTGGSDNARGGEGYYFLSGWVPVQANGSWSSAPFGAADPNPIPNGDYEVSITCTGQVPEVASWDTLTSPSPISITMDGTGTSAPTPPANQNNWKWLQDTADFVLCLGGVGVLAFPFIVAFMAGGPAGVAGMVTGITRIPLIGGAAAATAKKCASSVLGIQL